ncbi:MAG: pilus assembly protein CpaF, partial [Planctomycetia bacterium]|nr:pilus assembly protein CpaF [Planctomycetia bacterium]
MKDAVRVILVDPNAGSRQTLHRQVEGLKDFDLVEVCHTYQAAVKRIAALTPDMVIVVVDDDLEQALALIDTVSRTYPGVALVPAGSDGDATTILRA